MDAPAYSFGRAPPRFGTSSGHETPGPGEYLRIDNESAQEKRSVSKTKTANMGSPRKTVSHTISDKALREKTSSPGPGAYHQPSSASTSKTFAFGARPSGPPPSNHMTPGPGQYDLDDNPGNVVRNGNRVTTATRSKMAGHSFTSKPKTRANVSDEGPGPGAYYAAGSSTNSMKKNAGGKFVMGSPRFADTPANSSPGPGAYDTNHFDTMKHAKTKREKTNLKGATFGVAPRARSPPTAAALSARGKAKATFFDDLDAPGPGTYSNTNFLGNGASKQKNTCKFGGAPRFAAPKEQDGVGPGSYEPEADMNLRPKDTPPHKMKGIRIGNRPGECWRGSQGAPTVQARGGGTQGRDRA